MKKYKYTILGLLLFIPFITMAVNITVPQAPGTGYILESTSKGNYNPTANNLTFLKLDQTTPQTVINGAPIFNALQYNISATPLTNAEGLLQWNATDGTLDLGMSGGDIKLQVGQEMFTKVRNVSGSTILNGIPVYLSGRTGNRPNIYLAKGDADATSMVAGITTQDITSPSDGFITTMGYVRGIKTDYTGSGVWGTTWLEGDKLYVSASVAGQLTNVIPSAPNHSDIIGTVGVVHSSLGSILVNIQRHSTLQELSDVNGTALTLDGQIPVWNNTSKYFDFTKNINSYLPLAGGTMTGNILMTSNKIIGGSTTTSDLTLQTTSGIGATGADMHFLVGNNGATEAMTILNSGNVGIGTTAPTGKLDIQGLAVNDLPTYSAEFLLDTGWTSTDWTGDFATGWTHTTGNTTVLSQSKVAVNATKYQIAYTVTGRTAGSFTIGFGGQSNAGITATGAWGPTTSSTANLTITPTTDFNGKIIISIKSITDISNPLVNLKSSDGTARIEMRANTATGNTFIGVGAGRYNTTGTYNTANGMYSLFSNTTGFSNTANGYRSLSSNTTGFSNTANGYASLSSNTTGNSNTANGYASLYSNTTGTYNTANGYQSLYSNTTGTSNTANGMYSLFSNTTGISNTANGYRSLYSNTTGISNTANGVNSLYSNTTGTYNTANGYQSLYSNTTGTYNTANGYQSLYSNTTGSNNTDNGYQSLYSNTTGFNNTANGMYSLYSNTTGNSNTANGYASLSSNTTGFNNTANGYASLYSNTTGTSNTALGYQSARYIADGTTGRTTGSNGLYLGNDTKASADGTDNEIVIGYNAIGLGSNTAVYGNTSMTKHIFSNGNVGIGTTSPTAVLHIKESAASPYAYKFTNRNNTATWGMAVDSITVDDGYLTINDNTGSTLPRLVISNTGNVGIGTTAPDTKLQVVGDIEDYTGAFINDGNLANRSGLLIQGGLDDNTITETSTLIGFKDGDGTNIGSITFGSSAVSYNTTSDERLKNLVNEKTLSSLNTLTQIKVHDFTWKNDINNNLYTGIFAQELYEVYPQAIAKPNKEEDYWMVDYSKLTPVIIASIQEMNLKLENINEFETDEGGNTIINTWRESLLAWFGNEMNGITEFFTKKIRTEQVCLKKSDGTDFCINGDQLEEIINNGQVNTSSDSPDSQEPEIIPSEVIPTEVTPSGDTTIDTDSSTEAPADENPLTTDSPSDEILQVVEVENITPEPDIPSQNEDVPTNIGDTVLE